MFTLKFYRNPNDYVAVSCASYDVMHRGSNIEMPSGATISIYPGLTHQGGTDFHVGLPQKPGEAANPNANWCYVENSTGKTVDRIGPF